MRSSAACSMVSSGKGRSFPLAGRTGVGLRRLGRRPTHPPACSNSLSPLYRGQGQGKEESYCREPRQRDCLTREQKATDTRFLLDFSLPLLLRSAGELVLPRPPAGSDHPSGSCWRKVCRGELCKYSRLKAGKVTADLYLMQMFPMFCSIVLLINKNQPKTKKALGVVCVTWTEPLACTCLRNGDAACHGGAAQPSASYPTFTLSWGTGGGRRPQETPSSAVGYTVVNPRRVADGGTSAGLVSTAVGQTV